jgi:homoserine O-acetyltransferase
VCRQTGWCAAWYEAQRQCIYDDDKFQDGRYHADDPPLMGLATARKFACLTYKSKEALDGRFAVEENAASVQGQSKSLACSLLMPETDAHGLKRMNGAPRRAVQQISCIPAYLRYNAQKFAKAFDANCYISMSLKLDTHDVGRGRADSIPEALRMIEQPALIICAASDGLYSLTEHRDMADNMPRGQLCVVDTPEGHDFFVIEAARLNERIRDFLLEVSPVQGVKDWIEVSGLIDL